MSAGLALHVLEHIQAAGVRTVCVCPGARNAEWVELLAKNDLGFEVLWFYEERSAAFFALGRMRGSGRPAAVVTTSGTAAGELLPAAMEAYYSGQPLFLLTADRPRRFRGSGAPQAAEQSGIFGVYAEHSFDLEDPERISEPILPAQKPIHLNVCFEDPNSVSPLVSDLRAEMRGDKRGVRPLATARPFQPPIPNPQPLPTRPLVIVGALDPHERPAVERYLTRLGAPVYLESLSGLRPSAALEGIKIKVGDRLWNRAKESGYNPDGVIRIGGVPTHRFWRDLEDLEISVLSLSRLEFSGLGRPSTLIQGSLEEVLDSRRLHKLCAEAASRLLEEDRALYGCLNKALASEPDSEPALMRTLSEALPVSSKVYLGNSLPIREWDLAGDWADRGLELYASRGLNGIDGQLSTFLGLSRSGKSNWAILGDLTTLYDLSGPWPIRQMEHDLDANLVVFNNSGGKIFERMFPTQQFQNSHSLSFEHWAAMWGMRYELATSAAQLGEAIRPGAKGMRVIELRPDPDSTGRFWAKFQGALS